MPQADDRFRWHPAALIAGEGAPILAKADVDGGAIHHHPAALALVSAFAMAADGKSFRIGGGDDPPREGTAPMFETLTSGTSGTPRRIWRSQASWTASFAVNAGLFGIGPGTNVVVLGQLVHSLALYGALEALHLGATLHLLADQRPDRQRHAIADSAIEVLYATPAQARLLTEAKGPTLPDLRVVLIGGSKLHAAVRQSVNEMAPNAQLCEFYGSAETSFLTLARPDDPPLSVGRPYPGVTLAIRDASWQSLLPGEIGEVWAKSPFLCEGYVASFGSAIWRDGWLSVGEIGRFYEGALYLSGRKDRIVQIADQSVSPEEIEAFMINLRGINQVAVLPCADAKRGHVLIAVAMGNPLEETVILNAIRAQFGPLKSPRRIDWRADWPTLASGKTDLAALARTLA